MLPPPPQRRKPTSGSKMMASSSRRLCLALLFTVVAIVQAGVLPPDEKGAAGLNLGNYVPTAEEQSSFMDRFLSKVTSSPGKLEDKPEPAVLEHDEEEAEEEELTVESRRGGGRHGRRRHKKHRGGDHRHHGDRHHHHDDHYDGHDDGGHYLDGYEEDVFAKASVDCRFDVYPYAANPEECSKVSLKNFKPDLIFDDPHKEHSGGGACFWDFQLAKLEGGTNACLCPRKKKECHQKKQCYWFKHRVPADKHKDSKGHHHHDGKDSKDHHKDEKEMGVCMHNSERFYNLMARLLAKRGKKDLSLKIQYSSAPARGKLPWGPKGPAIIGYGEELGNYLDKIYPDKNPWNYQFQEGFDPYLWLGYQHPDPNHHKGGRKGHKGGRHFGKGGHHHYGGYGHGKW